MSFQVSPWPAWGPARKRCLVDRDGRLRHFNAQMLVLEGWREMGQIISNIVSLGLLVLLFTAIARRTPDDRLRCWVAAWIWTLVHTGLKLWTPESPVWRLASVCVGIDALALAAIF